MRRFVESTELQRRLHAVHECGVAIGLRIVSSRLGSSVGVNSMLRFFLVSRLNIASICVAVYYSNCMNFRRLVDSNSVFVTSLVCVGAWRAGVCARV